MTGRLLIAGVANDHQLTTKGAGPCASAFPVR
jgi:hypothetical protein